MEIIKNFIQYHTLNKASKSLLLISVITSIGQIIFGTFINIYIYQIFQGRKGVLRGTLCILTTTFIAFIIVGIISRKKKINIKKVLMAAMIAFGISFLFFLTKNIFVILIGYLVYGLGNGLYYCGLNTYELKRVETEDRGKYSGIMSAFLSTTKIVIPLIISGLFVIGTNAHINTYYMLIPIGLIICSLSLIRVKKIPDEWIPKLETADIKQFFQRKHIRGLTYISLRGIFGITGTIFIIISFYILKTEINLGIYTSLVALLTIMVMFYVGKRVKNTNRVKYLGIISLLMSGIYIFYAQNLNVLGFIIASINNVFLLQVYFIIDKVNNMHVLEELQPQSKNIFGSIVSAEALLYVTRFLALTALLFFVNQPSAIIMQYSLIIISVFILLIRISLWLRERNRQKSTGQ